MRSYAVACAGVVLGFLMMTGSVMAQDAKSAPTPQIYNGATGSGTTVKPIFIQSGTEQSAGMKTTTPYTSDSKTSDGQMTEADYQAMAKKVEADNDKIQESRVAQIKSQYESTKAQEQASDAAAAQQRAQALAQAGGGAGAQANAAKKDQENPYAGKTVVFTGAKKSDKPVRLFNVK